MGGWLEKGFSGLLLVRTQSTKFFVNFFFLQLRFIGRIACVGTKRWHNFQEREEVKFFLIGRGEICGESGEGGEVQREADFANRRFLLLLLS